VVYGVQLLCLHGMLRRLTDNPSAQLLGYFKPSQDEILEKFNEVAIRISRDHGAPKANNL
jgi:hypothetical protein